MKRSIFLILGLAFVFLSCNDNSKEEDKRYTQKSDEIEVVKGLIANYENGNWEAFKKHYADTAQIYHNSREGTSLDNIIAGHKEGTSGLSTYSFVDENDEYEMVVTDEGNTWVNYWGLWEGTIAENDQQVAVPVHLTARFVDGKIVEEHAYWDNVPMMMAMNELEMAKKEQDSIEDSDN